MKSLAEFIQLSSMFWAVLIRATQNFVKKKKLKEIVIVSNKAIYRITLICCHTSQGAEESIVTFAVPALTLCHSQYGYDF
jgi:hypothetical protein